MTDKRIETEWELALKKFGIIENKTVAKEKEIETNFYKFDKNEKVNDVFDDDEQLESIRRQRINQIKAFHEKAKFGYVYEITAADYTTEINEAGKDIWVILHLYQENVQKCLSINASMNTLAAQYPMIKFVRSVATKCIQNYPDSSVPTIFIYRNNNLICQYIGQQYFGTPNKVFTDNDLFKILQAHKMVEIYEDCSEDEETAEQKRLRIKHNKIFTGVKY
uniref:Viral IAP-associated factor homolog (Trinotate prediction) n=1 Tax=Henneguya salminicola TaxID=69463 RepID=A0A6G3MHH1_HENSL